MYRTYYGKAKDYAGPQTKVMGAVIYLVTFCSRVPFLYVHVVAHKLVCVCLVV